VDFFDIVRWAHDNDVLYVNASLESWDPSAETYRKPLVEKSLYNRYSKLLTMVAAGANPRRRSWITARIPGSFPIS
jgi:homospermidine synthase